MTDAIVEHNNLDETLLRVAKERDAALAEVERLTSRQFPIQGYGSIPWHIAQKAYGAYAAKYGTRQSLERLAERHGFGVGEMDELYPPWRDEVDENKRLRSAIEDAIVQYEAVKETDIYGTWTVDDISEVVDLVDGLRTALGGEGE